MTNIKLSYFLLIAVITGLWLAADPILSVPYEFFALRASLVKVEGPYGCFDFSGSKPRQIWVAGGIGITPFIARMEALAHRSDDKSIDLFYSTSAPDEGFIAKVQALAQAAQVRLHLLVTAQDGRLDVEHICRTVPQWPSADVWFRGPVAFNRAIHRDFGVKGLAASDFHQELFDLR